MRRNDAYGRASHAYSQPEWDFAQTVEINGKEERAEGFLQTTGAILADAFLAVAHVMRATPSGSIGTELSERTERRVMNTCSETLYPAAQCSAVANHINVRNRLHRVR